MNAIGFYRASRWLYLHKVPVLPGLIKGITFVLFNTVFQYTAEIGKGTKFSYVFMGCVVHMDTKIGEQGIIGQNTTISRSLDLVYCIKSTRLQTFFIKNWRCVLCG